MDQSALLKFDEIDRDLNDVKRDVKSVKKRLQSVENEGKEIIRSVSEVRMLINTNQVHTNETLASIQNIQLKSSEKLGFLKGLGLISLAALGGGGATVATTAANNDLFKSVLNLILESL